jgi:hypothetical protein
MNSRVQRTALALSARPEGSLTQRPSSGASAPIVPRPFFQAIVQSPLFRPALYQRTKSPCQRRAAD